MASILPVIVKKKEQTNKEKYVFYCSVSQIHINSEKNTECQTGDKHIRSATSVAAYSRTIPDWNKLPEETVIAPSVDAFEARLTA